jgi:hypothetical protein
MAGHDHICCSGRPNQRTWHVWRTSDEDHIWESSHNGRWSAVLNMQQQHVWRTHVDSSLGFLWLQIQTAARTHSLWSNSFAYIYPHRGMNFPFWSLGIWRSLRFSAKKEEGMFICENAIRMNKQIHCTYIYDVMCYELSSDSTQHICSW